MESLQRVALGKEAADTVITNGRVIQTVHGRIEDRDIAIVDGKIAAIFPDGTSAIGEETEVIDADDRVVSPGFVDAHAHMDHDQTLEKTYPHVLKGGATTLIEEVTFLGATFGAEAVREMLALDDLLEVDIRPTVPPQELFDTFEPAHADADGKQALLDLVDDDRIVGAGETGWIYVVGRDSGAGDLYKSIREQGKRVVGHGAGVANEKLSAFASVATIDHEVITGDEIVARLENGVDVVCRYGTTRDDIDAIADAYNRVGANGMTLGTDGISPRKLINEGYMDAVVREAIDRGVDAIDAIRMATKNPADHFKLDAKGVIAPGRDADIILFDELETVDINTVLSGGEVVVEDGQPLVSPQEHDYPDRFYDSINLEPSADIFRVSASEATQGTVRSIQYEQELVTSETVVEPPAEDGELHASPEDDILKATVIDRHPNGSGRAFTGFVTGFGMDRGAVATSLSVERTGVVVVGADDESMDTAVHRLKEMAGGWVAVEDGTVFEEFSTPVGGVCTDIDEVSDAARHYDEIEDAFTSLNIDIDRPLFGVQCLTHPGVPALRLTYSGYADIIGREVKELAP